MSEMIRKSVVIMFILTLVCLLSCIETEGPDDNNFGLPIDVGEKAPDFSLENATGGWISLSNYKNKNVVLVFHKGST